jgi:hypothetical protein
VTSADGGISSSISVVERRWWRDEQFGSGGTRRWRMPCRVIVIERSSPGATTTRIVEHIRTDRSNSPDATDPSRLLDIALDVASTIHATALRAAAHLASCHPEAGYVTPPECRLDGSGRALGAMVSGLHPGLRGFRIDVRSCAPYSDQPIARMGGNPNAVAPPTPDARRLFAPQGSLELWDDRRTDSPGFTLALMRTRMGDVDVPRDMVDAAETMRSIGACRTLAA